MLVIVETRCDPIKLRKTINLLGFDGFLATEVNGYAGGIITAWKKDDMTVTLVDRKFQFMQLKVNYKNGSEWFFTPIYASPIEENRKILREDLKKISDNMHYSWMLAGDFNDIACSAEKRGGVDASFRKCSKFVEIINVCKLIDLGYVGSKFTWRGPIYHGGCRIFERLDRALCNDNWRVEYPEAYVKVLPRLDFSDHHSILICPFGDAHVVAPRQFRFESAWQLEASYRDMLVSCWEGDKPIQDNLQNLQSVIKDWKFKTLDVVLAKKRKLMARIGGIQNRLQNGGSFYRLCELEKNLQLELSEILRQEEMMWFQRSRAKWLADGDRNARYCHLKVNNRRRRNNIVMLRNEQGIGLRILFNCKVW